jgi:hypothetical protein
MAKHKRSFRKPSAPRAPKTPPPQTDADMQPGGDQGAQLAQAAAAGAPPGPSDGPMTDAARMKSRYGG